MVYIVVLKKNSDMQEQLDVQPTLAEMGQYLILTDGTYLLKSDRTAVEVRDAFKKNNDGITIFVSAVRAPAAWRNMDAENEEIKNVYSE